MASVVVVGAGIIGLAAARELARRGASVTVVERDLAGAGTSSRGEGNMLVSDKHIEAEAALALRSLALWSAFAEESVEPFEYEEKGGLIAATTSGQLELLAAQAEHQRALGIHSTVLSADEAREREPGLVQGLAGGLWFPQDAQVMPIHAVRALRRAALDLGVTERVGVEPTALAPLSAGVRLQLSDGSSLDADAVVLATGPWSATVAERLGGAARVFPRRGLLLVTEPLPPDTVRHKVYDGRYVEAVASDEAAAQVAPVVESTQSGTVLIGSTREAVGWDQSIRWDLAGELARNAIALFPALGRAEVIRTYQGFRPATPDHLPLIGPDAQVEGLFHCSGHEGAGIGLAMATAELIADAVLDGRVDPAHDPRRFADAADATDVADPPPPPTRSVTFAADGDAKVTHLGRGTAGGSTVAAGLLVAGQQSWRTTRFDQRPRGLFCGIGHCHDCVLPDADGRTVRACLQPSDPTGADAPETRSPSAAPDGGDRLAVDVLVVGAGPGGLAAAAAASTGGRRVAVIDRYDAAGGQIGRQPADATTPVGPWSDLIVDGTAQPVHLPDTAVVAVRRLDAGQPSRFEAIVLRDGRLGSVLSGHIVLATGAREVVAPFPGWTLPGVVTAGALQALVKREGASPWRRVGLGGSGPLLLAVADAVRSAGTAPAFVLEAQPLRRLVAIGMPVAGRNPGKAVTFLRLAGLHPPRFGWRVVEALGDRSVTAAVLSGPRGRTETVELDALAVSSGLVPDVGLAVQLGCETRSIDGMAGVAVAVDAEQRTSVDGVLAVGEITGVGGADKAVAEGRLAAAAVIADLGGPDPSPALCEAAQGWRTFAADLGRLYPWDDGWAQTVADEEVICRCEEVPVGAVRRAIADGAVTARAVKGLTRCGMGRCQGAVCGPLVTSALRATGHDDVGDLENRPVAAPVPMDQLARIHA